MPPASANSTSVVLEIPDSAAGFVIGKGGCKIKALEQKTGARVIILKKKPDSTQNCTQVMMMMMMMMMRNLYSSSHSCTHPYSYSHLQQVCITGTGPTGGDVVERCLGELENAVSTINVELVIVSVM